jgi:hypothetical protein
MNIHVGNHVRRGDQKALLQGVSLSCPTITTSNGFDAFGEMLYTG